MAEQNKSNRQDWWHTIPGTLTAIAAVITAVTGLIVGLHQAGWFSGNTNFEPASSGTTAPSIMGKAGAPVADNKSQLPPPREGPGAEGPKREIAGLLRESIPAIPPLPPPEAEASVFRFLAPLAVGLYYDFDLGHPGTMANLDSKIDFHIEVESKDNLVISQIKISPFNGAAVYIREPVSVAWHTDPTGYQTSGTYLLDKSGKWGCLTSEGRYCRLWAETRGNEIVVVAEVHPKP